MCSLETAVSGFFDTCWDFEVNMLPDWTPVKTCKVVGGPTQISSFIETCSRLF